MKKIILSLMFSLMFLSCGTKKDIDMTYGMPVSTSQVEKYSIKSVRYSLDRPEFNKLCKDERISSNLKKWSKASFKSWEDQKTVDQYYFIKDAEHPEEIYRLDLDIAEKDTTFIVETRKKIKR